MDDIRCTNYDFKDLNLTSTNKSSIVTRTEGVPSG